MASRITPKSSLKYRPSVLRDIWDEGSVSGGDPRYSCS